MKKNFIVLSRRVDSEFCYATNLDDVNEGIRQLNKSAVPTNNNQVSYDPTKVLGTIVFRCKSKNCIGILQAFNKYFMYLSWICIDDFTSDPNQGKVFFDTDAMRDTDTYLISDIVPKRVKIRYISSLDSRAITEEEFIARCESKKNEENEEIKSNTEQVVEKDDKEQLNSNSINTSIQTEDVENNKTDSYIQQLAHREAEIIIKETEIANKLQEVDRLLDMANKFIGEVKEQSTQDKDTLAIEVDKVYSEKANRDISNISLVQEIILRGLHEGDRVHINREYIDSISVFYKKGIETTSDLSRYKAIVTIQFEKKSINNIIAILEYDEKEELAIVEILSPFGRNNTSEGVIEQYYSKYLQQRKKNMTTGW